MRTLIKLKKCIVGRPDDLLLILAALPGLHFGDGYSLKLIFMGQNILNSCKKSWNKLIQEQKYDETEIEHHALFSIFHQNLYE